MTNDYRIVVASLSGVAMEELPPSGLSFTEILNGATSCSFDVPKHDAKCTRALLDPGARQILVYKADELKSFGILQQAQMTSDEQDTLAHFSAVGLWALLGAPGRYIDTDQVFTSIEQFDIVWDLIAYTQAKTDGDLGITRASVPASGITRSLTWYGYDRVSIADAIADILAAGDGFDFEIKPDKSWWTYYPKKGSSLPGVVLELGKNIESYTWLTDAAGLVTDETAMGSGSGANKLLAVSSDSDARTTYGLYESATSYSNIIDQTLLQGQADLDISQLKAPRDQPSIILKAGDPDATIDSFSVGDHVKVRIDHGWVQVDGMYRVAKRVVNITPEGQEEQVVDFDLQVAS